MARGVGLTRRHCSRDKDPARHGEKELHMFEPMPRLILPILNRAAIASIVQQNAMSVNDKLRLWVTYL